MGFLVRQAYRCQSVCFHPRALLRRDEQPWRLIQLRQDGICFYYSDDSNHCALCVCIPSFLSGKNANLVETVREWNGEAVWLGTLLTLVGFFYSLGWNFFFYRICYDVIPLFRGMRMPTRGAMFASLGLAILAGVGVKRIADLLRESRLHLSRRAVVVVICVLLLFELNAAPLPSSEATFLLMQSRFG